MLWGRISTAPGEVGLGHLWGDGEVGQGTRVDRVQVMGSKAFSGALPAKRATRTALQVRT